MLRRLVALLAGAALLIGVPLPAHAAPSAKKYSSCKALWKDFPTGVTGWPDAAAGANRIGLKRPRLNRPVYLANLGHLKTTADFIICAVRIPPVVPSAPANVRVSNSTSFPMLSVYWDQPATTSTGMVYDVYLDGTKVQQDITLTAAYIRDLNPGQTYTVGVLARSAAGSSPITEGSGTVATAEQIAHPGLVKVVYSGTGTVDVTIATASGTSQYSNVTNPSYTYWFAPKDFVYMSVQNQSDSGSVSCSITSNGRYVASNSSAGAYVIATCSGTAVT